MMPGPAQTKIPQALIKDLRHLLASAISDFKAYDVPAICSRIGLADGSNDEAFASKYKYASTRLNAASLKVIIAAAHNLLLEEVDFLLSEVVNKVEECSIHTISEITRRRIVSLFNSRQICTEIEEIDFLRRVWPIDEMPSHYYPGTDRRLAEDILQHTVRNYDWENKELLENLGAFTCSQAQFFKFIELATDPLVQKEDAQKQLVESINGYLFHDSYKLYQVRVLSGCPFYEVKPVPKGAPGDENISEVLKAFDPNEIHGRWTVIMESRNTNPGRAITLARTLLEDVCKWIIVEAGETYDEKVELPDLYKQLAKILKLAPDDYTEQIFKQILSGCHSVVQGLGSLRNKLGDAHSLGPLRARPYPRHAELAGNLAGAMATFLVSTWQVRKEEAARAKAG